MSRRSLVAAATLVAIACALGVAWSSLSPSRAESAVNETLPSWNPNIACTADLVTIAEVLGPAYPSQALNGSPYQRDATGGGVLHPRALSPACTITNVNGENRSTLVEIHNVYLASYEVQTGDCSTTYKNVNGGGPYPDNATICDRQGSIYTRGTMEGSLEIEVDQDWQAKGYCGSGVPYCDADALAQQVSNGTIALDVQGFVYWDGESWELHPFTSWTLSERPPPPLIPTSLFLEPEAPDPSDPGQTVTVTAVLVREDTKEPLSGKSVPMEGSDDSGATWWPAGTWMTDGNGRATGSIVFAFAGQDQRIRARFDGDASFGSSVSNVESHVTRVLPPDFWMDADKTSMTIALGGSDSATLSLWSLHGFSGTVGLSVSIEAEDVLLPPLLPDITYPDAWVDPDSVTLTEGGSGTSTLTVSSSLLTTPGTYSVTVIASSGSITRSVTIWVEIVLL